MKILNKYEIKTKIVWEHPGFYLIGFVFLNEYNNYDKRIFDFYINLIFIKIALQISKYEPLEQLI